MNASAEESVRNGRPVDGVVANRVEGSMVVEMLRREN